MTDITDLARESLHVEAYCIELGALFPSPTNPRKRFPPEALAELAASIALDGILQPLLARPIPPDMKILHETKAELEIVCGERRYRAALLAGLAEVPVIVRSLTDSQVIRMQIVENLHREGVSAIEEAEGFGALQAQGLSAQEIAALVSKSKAYVYAALKLLALCPAGRDLVHAGTLSASVALLIARIPVKALQMKAIKDVTALDSYGLPLSVRAAATTIQNGYTVRLTKAVFDLTDAIVIPGAGSCEACPKRLGNEPACEPAHADVCTDPACYRAKQEAYRALHRRDALSAGQRIISGAEAKAIQPHGGTLHGGYVALSDKCYELEGYPTYGELLEQAGGGVETVLLDKPDNPSLVEIVEQAALSAALKASGVPLVFREQTAAKKHAEKEAALQQENSYRQALFAEVRQQRALMLITPDLQRLATFALTRLWEEYRFQVGKLWFPNAQKTESVKLLLARIPEMHDEDLTLLLRDILLIPEIKCSPGSDSSPTNLLAAAERLGINPERVRKDALNPPKPKADEAVMYKHPEHGATWSGRGRKPQWVTIWLADGKPLDELKVGAK